MATPSWTHVFAGLSGNVPASDIDDNFNQATQVTPSTVPSVPVVGGAVGTDGYAARSDHQHPMQPATTNVQTGTTYTLASTDNGLVVEFTNASAVTVTLPNSLAAAFNCLLCQNGAGQVTIAAGSGATLHQASTLTKTRAQWSQITLRVSSNAGAAAIYVASGDMA